VVALRKIRDERLVRVIGKVCGLNDDETAFEKTVSFMARQDKLERFRVNVDRVSHDNFAIVLQICFVWPSDLPKSHQAMKTSEEESEEEAVVIRG